MLKFDPKRSPITIPYLDPKNQIQNLLVSLAFAVLMLILLQLGAVYGRDIVSKDPSGGAEGGENG